MATKKKSTKVKANEGLRSKKTPWRPNFTGIAELPNLTLPQKRFLAAFAELGNITAAAELASLDRQHHYHWIWNQSDYKAAFEIAKEISIERLEAESRRRAMGKSDVLMIFLLKAARPEVYRDRYEHKHTGDSQSPIQQVVKSEYVSVEQLGLSLEVRKQILEAFRRKRGELNGQAREEGTAPEGAPFGGQDEPVSVGPAVAGPRLPHQQAERE